MLEPRNQCRLWTYSVSWHTQDVRFYRRYTSRARYTWSTPNVLYKTSCHNLYDMAPSPVTNAWTFPVYICSIKYRGRSLSMEYVFLVSAYHLSVLNLHHVARFMFFTQVQITSEPFLFLLVSLSTSSAACRSQLSTLCSWSLYKESISSHLWPPLLAEQINRGDGDMWD